MQSEEQPYQDKRNGLQIQDEIAFKLYCAYTTDSKIYSLIATRRSRGFGHSP